jgi:hypothetical protein
MRTFSVAFLMVAVLGLAAGCSSGGGQLFNSGCEPPCAAPQPVAQCAPPPCDPQPVCAPVTDPTVQGQRPPDARPGEVWCYVRVPAVTRQVEERVCVRPESCREVQVPAVTQQVERQVCVRPESTRQIPIPAEYEDRCEQICTAPARTEWARVDCEPTKLAEKEQVGECWTLKEIPPQYTTKTTRVCTKPASCRQECIPAEFKTEYETVIVEPARVDRIPVPAEYETRFREEIVCGPRWEWRRTTECEVPEVTGGADMYAPMDNSLPPIQDTAPLGDAPEAIGSPDDNAPPAGGLPPLR